MKRLKNDINLDEDVFSVHDDGEVYDDIVGENREAYADKDLEGIEKYETGVYKRKKNVFEIKRTTRRIRHPILNGASKSELKRGIIFSEILGRPKGY